MLKQTIEDSIALANKQEVVLDFKAVPSLLANAKSKRVKSLVSAETLAFQTVFDCNSQLIRQRLKSNSESAKQFNKVTVNVPNLVLNSFHQLKQDSLPLLVAMIAQVYHQIEIHTDELSKALKNNEVTSEIVKSINAQNPIEKNWFFLPYDLVRTLLNFDSIDDDYEANKFSRSTREIRELNLPLFFNRDEHASGEQFSLLTSMVGKLEGLHSETINVHAFENCFYWVHDKNEYFAFTIAPDFRNLLLMLMQDMKDGSKLRQILPYTRIDWHFLHFLPQRNNLRQMYLFIKSNIYNASSFRMKSASFEYSLDDLKRFMGVDDKSHYAENDSHFVRDKIRKVIDELVQIPGCEYNINILKRNIKTPGGSKKQIIKFNVEIKPSFLINHSAILKHIEKISEVSNFKNDWLIISCLRYCSLEQLTARIDKAYGKFLGLQKKAGSSKKYDHLTLENQISRFLSDDLQKFWQELASTMLVVNPNSSQSRLLNKIATNEYKDTKIHSSAAASLVQKRKRGRPSKNVVENELPKMSAAERKVYDKIQAKMLAEQAKNQKSEEDTQTQVVESEIKNAEDQATQPDLLNNTNIVPFPTANDDADQDSSSDIGTDFRVGTPANFTAPPTNMDSQWDGYTEQDILREYDEPNDFDETFLVTVENLHEHLLPVNGNADHISWASEYVANINALEKSDANAIFFELFSLTAILNEIEFDNKQFQSRSIKYIDLYREKLNIVLQTLFKFFGTYEQRQDQNSVQTFMVEKTAEILFESSDLSGKKRLFTRSLFVQLAKAVETGGMVSKLVLFSLRGQCVAYPFTE